MFLCLCNKFLCATAVWLHLSFYDLKESAMILWLELPFTRLIPSPTVHWIPSFVICVANAQKVENLRRNW